MCADVSFDLEPNEIRVLGALLEKQRTTPDAYPLSLNALRSATNQSTNRDPVVDYDEATIRDALHRLSRRRWARLASGPGSRAAKYRHLVDEALGLGPPELSVLAVLMLRGPQTPGELRQRTERLHAFPDAASLQAVLDALMEREMVVRLMRRPGQKEERYAHVLAGEDAVEAAAPAYVPAAAATPDVALPAPPPAASHSGHRLDRLEREGNELRGQVAQLRGEVAELREEVAALRRELGG